MKAIVNVNPLSAYAHCNGHTFDVVELMSNMIALNIKGSTVDFALKEIFIVDVAHEIDKCDTLIAAYKIPEKAAPAIRNLRGNLIRYMTENRMQQSIEYGKNSNC